MESSERLRHDAGPSGADDASGCALVTLVTSAGYVPGAVALARSARAVGTALQLVVLTTCAGDGRLAAAFDRVVEVEPVPNPRAAEARYADVYTKLRVWQLAEYRRVLFLDADTLLLRPVDEVVVSPAAPAFAAAPDVHAPDLFNAGVMLLQPDAATFERMLEAAPSVESYDTGDQGFLNCFFGWWYASGPECRLAAGWNAPPMVLEPAYLEQLWRQDRLYVAHFWGSVKPWHYGQCFDPGDGGEGAPTALQRALRANKVRERVGDRPFALLKRWWEVYLGVDLPDPADVVRSELSDDDDDDDGD